MFKKSLLLFFLISTSQFACAEKLTSIIPLAINHVQTQRVADSVIRIIKYNMEVTPRLEIERLETPTFKLVEKIVIEKLKFGSRWIHFKNSAGTYIESMEFKKGIFYFTVDHFFAGTSGGEVILNCKVDVNNNKIREPFCVRQ